MQLPSTDRHRELLDNAKRALNDSIDKVKCGAFNEALKAILHGIDVLANLNARLTGQVVTEKEAERENHKRYVGFLREEIPEWTEHYAEWEGKRIAIDLSEMSYFVRCKQTHEYSELTSPHYPIRLNWAHKLYGAPIMWATGDPTNSKIDAVEINGFKLMQRLVEVAQKYTSIYSSTETHFDCRINPNEVYEALGTIRRIA